MGIRKRRGQEGQAIVEYVLMLVIVIGAISVLTIGFRRVIRAFWVSITNDIAAKTGPGDPRKPHRF